MCQTFDNYLNIYNFTHTGLLIEKFSDHQPYFTCLDQINVKDPPPKYIRIMKQTPDIITNLCNEIRNSDLVDKLDSSIDADPNKNYEIVNNIIQSAKEKHMPYVLKKYHKHKHKKSYWISTGIMKSIKTRDKLYRTLKNVTKFGELCDCKK